MKKLLKIALLAAALAALLAVSALADTPAPTITTNTDTNKTYTVSIKGLTEAKQYLLLVMKTAIPVTSAQPADPTGTFSLNAADIMYINQDAGATDGTISFSSFLPMSSAFWNAAYLAGGDLTVPKFLGYLGYTSAQDVPANVTVTYNNVLKTTALNVKVTVKSSGTEIKTATATTADGKLNENVPQGDYDLVITADGYLTHIVHVTVGTDAIVEDYTAYAGDTDNSGAINATDLGNLLADFGKTTKSTFSDLDNSGAINATDLGYLLGNFGKVSDK